MTASATAETAKEALVRRIRAMLAKTVDNGATEAEAMSALAKAQEIMAKHGLDRDAVEAEAFVEELFQSKRSVRGFYWGKEMAFGVSLFTGAFAFSRSAEEITFAGRESDAIFAYWLLDSLDSFVTRNAAEYVNSTGGAKHTASKRVKVNYSQTDLFSGASVEKHNPETDLARKARILSFGKGVSERIAERLRELATDATKERSSKARAKLQTDGMRFRHGSSSHTSAGDSKAYEAGRARGDTVQFNQPVNGGRGPLAIGRN